MLCLHLVPVPPTLTIAHSGENPASSGSSNEAHAATTSSLVLKELLEKAWAANGWLASAVRAVDIPYTMASNGEADEIRENGQIRNEAHEGSTLPNRLIYDHTHCGPRCSCSSSMAELLALGVIVAG